MSNKPQPPTSTPGYDNPTGNKGDLYDEAKGHPHGGRHVGKQRNEGQHEQRPQPHDPVGHSSDKSSAASRTSASRP